MKFTFLILTLTLISSSGAQDKSDTLPFAKRSSEHFEFMPLGSFSITYSHFGGSLKPLQDFLNETENYFREQGNDIPHKTFDEDISRQVIVSFYARIYKTFGIGIEVGKASNSDVDFWHSALYVQYFHNFKKIQWLKPYAGIGLAKYRY